jgi:hypothetical protein
VSKLQQAKNELWQIGRCYPTIGGILQKRYPNGGTYGEHWAKLLCDLDPGHLSDVCDEYAKLVRPLPDHPDQLPQAIWQEVKARMIKDQDALQTYEYRQMASASKGAWDKIAADKTGHAAIRLGEMVKAGTITRATNNVRMDELMAFDKGGERPAWLNQL